MAYKKTWTYGDKGEMARKTSIPLSYFSDILHNRKPCRPELAINLEVAARELGYQIPRDVWIFPDKRFGNDLFPPFGKTELKKLLTKYF